MSDLVVTGVGLLLPDTGEVAREVSEIVTPECFEPRALRRTSRVGRLALVAADAALTQSAVGRNSELGLIVGTALADVGDAAGFIRRAHERGARYAGPLNFQRSGHNAAAGELALLYGLNGYNLTVTGGARTGGAALAASTLAIAAGRCRAALCIAVDALSPVLLEAREALGVSQAVGEAAVALVIERASDAARRGAAILAGCPELPVPGPGPVPLLELPGGGVCCAADLVAAACAILGAGPGGGFD